MTHTALQEHIESVLSRHRERGEHLTRQQVDDLFTDACAAVLSLEAERRRIERRLTIQHDASEQSELGPIDEELAALRRLVRLLRTAVDWVRQAEADHQRSSQISCLLQEGARSLQAPSRPEAQ